jgi:gamma-tubulin complex component 5
LENIEVDYRLPWPVLNIIQPASSFPTYRRVFTFLLQLRRARYLLERLRSGDVAEKSFFALKQRFLWFSSVIVQYLTDLVLRPTTAALKRDLANADDVDAMVAVHAAFVEKVREQCLLGTKLAPIHGGIVAVLNLAVKFARVHDAFHHSPQDTGASPRSRRRRRDDDSSDEEDAESAPPGSPSSTGVTSIFGEDDVGADGEVVDEEHRYGLKMAKIMEELMGLVGFVKDGLRGVARAGVMPHLEMLAEALDGYGGGGGWAGI